MREVKLPISVEPARAAQKRSQYVGFYAEPQMSRLREICTVTAPVTAQVDFVIDPQGLVVIQGQCHAALELLCQRCNAPFVREFELTFCYTPVKPGQNRDELPEAYEPVEIDDEGEISLLDLIEDELIVAIPYAPMHDMANCGVNSEEQVFGDISSVKDERPNPFAVLSQLKDREE